MCGDAGSAGAVTAGQDSLAAWLAGLAAWLAGLAAWLAGWLGSLAGWLAGLAQGTACGQPKAAPLKGRCSFPGRSLLKNELIAFLVCASAACLRAQSRLLGVFMGAVGGKLRAISWCRSHA